MNHATFARSSRAGLGLGSSTVSSRLSPARGSRGRNDRSGILLCLFGIAGHYVQAVVGVCNVVTSSGVTVAKQLEQPLCLLQASATVARNHKPRRGRKKAVEQWWKGRVTREIKKKVVIAVEILERNEGGELDEGAVSSNVGDDTASGEEEVEGVDQGDATPTRVGGDSIQANSTVERNAEEQEDEKEVTEAAEQVAFSELQAVTSGGRSSIGLGPEPSYSRRSHSARRRVTARHRLSRSRALPENYVPDPYETPIGASMSSSIAVTLTYFVVYVGLASTRTWNQARQHQYCAVERVLESTMSAVYFAPMLCTVFLAVTKRAETLSRGDPEAYDLPPTFVQIAMIASAAAFCAHAALWCCGEILVALSQQRPYRAPATGRPRKPPRGSTRTLPQADASTEVETVEGAAPGAATEMSSSSGTPAQTGASSDDSSGCSWSSACSIVFFWLSHFALGIMHVALNVIFIGLMFMREPAELYAEQGSPHMSAGTVCTLILAIPYFAVYLVLHALQSQSVEAQNAKTHPDASSSSAYSAPFFLVLTEVAKLAASALSLSPMLCVLFLGTQLAEEWADDQHPGGYVEVCIYMCTIAVIAQLVLAVIGPFAAGAELHVTGPERELDFVTRNHRMFRFVGILRWIVMIGLYAGVEVVCTSLWKLRQTLPITRLLHHLVGCFFLMYAVQWFIFTMRDIIGRDFLNAIRVLRIAKDVVSFCPMLAVLFLESWVRPRHLTTSTGKPGVPQCYAQDSMYLATLAFLVQLLIVLLSGIISQTPVSTTSHRANWQRRDCVAFVLLLVFHAATLVLCGSVLVVIGSLFVLTPENANDTGAWIA